MGCGLQYQGTCRRTKVQRLYPPPFVLQEAPPEHFFGFADGLLRAQHRSFPPEPEKGAPHGGLAEPGLLDDVPMALGLAVRQRG